MGIKKTLTTDGSIHTKWNGNKPDIRAGASAENDIHVQDGKFITKTHTELERTKITKYRDNPPEGVSF